MFNLNVLGVNIDKKHLKRTIENICNRMDKLFTKQGFEAKCLPSVNLDSLQIEINLEICLDSLTINFYKSLRLYYADSILVSSDDDNLPFAAFKYKDTVIVPFSFKTIVPIESASEYLSPVHLILLDKALASFEQAMIEFEDLDEKEFV